MPTLRDKLDTVDAPETELVETCPLCHSNTSEFLFWNVDRLHHLPGKFGVIECKGCGLARLSPRPKKENLGFYYPEGDYYSYQSNDDPSNQISSRKLIGGVRDKIRYSVLESLGYSVPTINRWQKIFQPLFVKFLKEQATFGWNDRLPRFVPGGKALEVGCGSGYALNVLKRLGWEVNGIEMSQKASQAAKENYDIDVFCGEIADAPFERESFDYVHLSHVIEHLTDPVEELKNIAALMKPGGIIYIEAPNIDSYGQHKSGKHWLHWDSPRHLYGFSPATIRKTVEKADLKIEKLTTLLGNFWEWETIYKIEEAIGEKMPDRENLLANKEIGRLPLRFANRLKFSMNSNYGDTLCCWAVKQ